MIKIIKKAYRWLKRLFKKKKSNKEAPVVKAPVPVQKSPEGRKVNYARCYVQGCFQIAVKRAGRLLNPYCKVHAEMVDDILREQLDRGYFQSSNPKDRNS